jgi:hypothetical protein
MVSIGTTSSIVRRVRVSCPHSSIQRKIRV